MSLLPNAAIYKRMSLDEIVISNAPVKIAPIEYLTYECQIGGIEGRPFKRIVCEGVVVENF